MTGVAGSLEAAPKDIYDFTEIAYLWRSAVDGVCSPCSSATSTVIKPTQYALYPVRFVRAQSIEFIDCCEIHLSDARKGYGLAYLCALTMYRRS